MSCSLVRESTFPGVFHWLSSAAPWLLIVAGTVTSALAFFYQSILMRENAAHLPAANLVAILRHWFSVSIAF
jgi:hypothetical protein